METNQTKRKKAWAPLLLIPTQIVVAILLITLAAMGDSAMADPNALGHPAPVLTLIVGIIVAIATVVITIAAIVISIKRAAKNKRSAE